MQPERVPAIPPVGVRQNSTDPDLAALIGARICHDLANPIGAIGNGVEIMELEGYGAIPGLDLIAQCVTTARARLRFLGLALGAPRSEESIGAGELGNLVMAQFGKGRMTLDWSGPEDAQMSHCEARLGLLALMCLEAALPFGGRVAVRHGGKWHLEAEALRLRDLGDLWEVVRGAKPGTDIAASMVQFVLLSEAARRSGREVRVERSAGRIVVTV